MNTLRFFGAAAGAMIALVATAAAEPAAITTRELRGSGGWKAERQKAGAAQRWDLQVARSDDNTLRGRVTHDGSPLLRTGKVGGRIAGRTVSGTITDDAGNQVATFDGTITGSGLSGKYTDRTGEVGTWEWQGTLPE